MAPCTLPMHMQVDWLPTVLKIADIPVPPALEPHLKGYDISGILLNNASEPSGSSESRARRCAFVGGGAYFDTVV